MSEHPETTADLLDGWKAIAEYLGKSVRTAQRWETAFAMPVHRVGDRDGENVYAYRSALEAWRRQQTPAALGESVDLPGRTADALVSPPAPGKRPLSRQAGAGVGFLALAIAAGALAVSYFSVPTQPARWWVSGPDFIVYDDGMRELWRHRFAEPLTESAMAAGASAERALPAGFEVPDAGVRHPAPVVFVDLDGDGRQEVLVVPQYGAGTLTPLYCFDSGGTERWTYTPVRIVTFGVERYGAPRISGIYVRRRPGGGADLFVTSCHESWFPSRVARLDPAGQVTAEYWSNGHVNLVAFAEIGGRSRVLIGSPNNETRGAALAVLDEERFGGSAPAATDKYRCADCPPGGPEYFLVFPRVPVTDVRGGFPWIGYSLTTTAGETLPNVAHLVLRQPGEAGQVYAETHYRLDRTFRVTGAEYGTAYRRVQRYLEQTGEMQPAESVDDERRLWPVLRWNGSGFDRIDGPERN